MVLLTPVLVLYDHVQMGSRVEDIEGSLKNLTHNIQVRGSGLDRRVAPAEMSSCLGLRCPTPRKITDVDAEAGAVQVLAEAHLTFARPRCRYHSSRANSLTVPLPCAVWATGLR